MYSFLEPEVLNGRLEQEILICQWFRTIVHKMFRVHGTNVYTIEESGLHQGILVYGQYKQHYSHS